MQPNYLLSSDRAVALYEKIKAYPIYDYHCHLSPQEIWEDRPYSNLGEMWLGGDHYKWRLMRAAGVPEEKITGGASWKEKFFAYAGAIARAAGNPLYHWTHMELSRYFGIEQALSPETAEAIWEEANHLIQDRSLSPRKLILQCQVAYLATTDDPADSLEYHQKLRDDPSWKVKVTPSYRLDNVLLLKKESYPAYIQKLSLVAGLPIAKLSDLEDALERRLAYFCKQGCAFADVGIPGFPGMKSDRAAAERAFVKALRGEAICLEEEEAFLREVLLTLGGLCARYRVVLQFHLAVLRNINTPLFLEKGPDCGGDCVGDVIPGSRIGELLNAMLQGKGLPRVILYTLNPSMTVQLAAIAGCFPGVRLGTAWWFVDHKRGIREVLQTVAEVSYLGSFLGMLTDSRSFLSYARHDYFRRILADLLAGWQETGEFEGDVEGLAKGICFENIQTWIGQSGTSVERSRKL